MKPIDTTKTGFGFRFASDAETRKAAGSGAFRGAIAKAGRNTNRADALLKRFD